jgi:pyrimidine deaminase RibD-like protein
MSKSDLKYIHQAMIVAEKSPCYNRHGCVIVRNGKIVSNGFNHYDVSKYSLSSNTTHAEIDALTKYFESCSFQPTWKKKRQSTKYQHATH